MAADDTADTGSATASTATGNEATQTTTHHKHHHKTSSTAATNATPVVAAAPSPAAPTSGVSGSKGGSTSRKSSEPSAPPPAETAGASATSSTATAAASPSTSATHPSRHHHGATAAAATATNAPPIVPNATGAKTPVVGTVPPSTPGTPAGVKPETAELTAATTAAATTAKGRHHRHGKTAAKPALPQPPIIVVPTLAPPLPTPAPVVATLPTPPPIAVSPSPTGSVPTVQTGLPIARPGAGTTATLPIAPIHTASLFNFPFHDYPQPRRHTQTYPWRTAIYTTKFWVGEGSTPLSGATNKMSAWDMNWVQHNGGADDENDMSGYASSDHASTLNPFYVALPFNDLAYPEKTARWLPTGWDKGVRRNGRPVSACQGRWIEIKNKAGRYCFAQWEDVGPVVTDDAEYVFGSARPSAYQGRGLDVSPAVAKYLGIESNAYTSWRFVDDPDVLPGMWLRYDEQALLFRAMEEEMHGKPTPRLQDLDEPVADPSDDSNHKKAGAARG